MSALALRTMEGAVTAALYVRLGISASPLTAWAWGMGWNLLAGLLSAGIDAYNRTVFAMTVLGKVHGKQD